MTPKEKAFQLVQKFEEYGWLDEKTSMWESAKQIALITVDEILAEYNRMNKYNFVIEKEYWQQVKEEIANL